eukprot:TRINITY_DN11698_c0_g1_i1.p1 TRINITY_DN11698_c0_g1~~TRINITY_DN11698_c0_g1_i1.p1  ORF type:complete len:113 (-),score=11.77 TRINITY_DN11698_c0_g1_i1:81-419(-)
MERLHLYRHTLLLRDQWQSHSFNKDTPIQTPKVISLSHLNFQLYLQIEVDWLLSTKWARCWYEAVGGGAALLMRKEGESQGGGSLLNPVEEVYLGVWGVLLDNLLATGQFGG